MCNSIEGMFPSNVFFITKNADPFGGLQKNEDCGRLKIRLSPMRWTEKGRYKPAS